MADLLIRGASEYATIIVTLGKAYNAISGEDYELVVLPTHGRLIDANVLYKKTAELEAQALRFMGTCDEKTEGWRRWATALNERTAFKYDVADALTVIEASEVEE